MVRPLSGGIPGSAGRARRPLRSTWSPGPRGVGLPGGWKDSPQIKALKALADPRSEWGFEVAYLVLDSNRRVNDFVQSKKDGVALLPPVPRKPEKKKAEVSAPPPPVPATPKGPEEEFLASIDKLSVGEVLKAEKKLGVRSRQGLGGQAGGHLPEAEEEARRGEPSGVPRHDEPLEALSSLPSGFSTAGRRPLRGGGPPVVSPLL